MNKLSLTEPDISNEHRASTLAIVKVRFEHFQEPVGIDVQRPRLSWIISTPVENWHQTAYEIEAYDARQQLRGQTGRVDSDESVLIAWPFAPLESRERMAVRVRVWGNEGAASNWSEAAWVEAGLFQPNDWTAHFITPDWEEDTSRANPCPLMRHEFDVRAGVRQARLYITALGLYEAQLNGAVVGDHVLSPGWTSYNHRLRYQTFDVTELLQPGRNAIGALLGDGWYRGRLGWGGGRRNIYGDRLALLAQLEIDYEDGSTDRITTDDTWRAATGPILASDLYDGETYDARLERPGWSLTGYADDDWAGVRRLERSLTTLVTPCGPPVRRTEVIRPVTISTSPSGRTLVDFGQNLVGWLRITVSGQAGHTITLRHAEVLENGELGTRPLRFARATDSYTLRGDRLETWEPRFTFHGFRYAEVEGWPGDLKPTDIEAVVLHSDMERTGWFECSDPLVNRLHENVVWSMRGNFVDIPTDCPQRDERLGWTGDIQVFTPTASFLYDVAGFLTSWLRDLSAEQAESNGVVPFFVPNVTSGPSSPAAAWGDAAVIVPWVLYQRYRDVGILETQFDSMRAWVDTIANLAGERRLWETGMQFGDWLDPSASPHRPGDARTSSHIVATAYFARSAELLGRAAEVLGREAEATSYLSLATEVRTAFCNEYVTPNGRLMSDATTAYALAVEFALLPDADQRKHAGMRLAKLVRGSGYRISTGFVGTPLVCDALCSAGEFDAAYRLLMQRDCPSWLYPVTMGATTIWERWDSLLPDGSVNPGEMTSFNHYALGAIADWLHRVVGGLAPAAPGYRRIHIQPRPGGRLTFAKVRHQTPYGLAVCSWRLDSETIMVEIKIPANTMATVYLPGKADPPFEIGCGDYKWVYPYQEARSNRPVLSVDSSLDELIEDESIYTQVMAILAQYNPEFADRLNGQIGLTLRQVASLNPNSDELLARFEEVLVRRKAA